MSLRVCVCLISTTRWMRPHCAQSAARKERGIYIALFNCVLCACGVCVCVIIVSPQTHPQTHASTTYRACVQFLLNCFLLNCFLLNCFLLNCLYSIVFYSIVFTIPSDKGTKKELVLELFKNKITKVKKTTVCIIIFLYFFFLFLLVSLMCECACVCVWVSGAVAHRAAAVLPYLHHGARRFLLFFICKI